MKILAAFLQVILGLVFIVSALSKLFPVEFLEFTLVEKGIAGWALSPYLARALIGFEFSLGLLLLFGLLIKRWVLTISLITLLIFTIYTLMLVINGQDEDCGCFGELIKLTPLESLVKNIALLFINILLFKFHYNWRSKFSGILIAFLIVISFTLPFILNPVYFSDVQPAEGTIPAEMPMRFSDGSTIKSGEGNFVLAMLSPGCPHCKIAARKLFVMSEKQQIPPVYTVFWGEESLIKGFFRESHSAFPYASWNDKGFLQMTEGRFPAVFVVEDGRIVRRLSTLSLTVENINGND